MLDDDDQISNKGFLLRKAGLDENGEQMYQMTDLGIQAVDDFTKPFHPLRKFIRKIFNIKKPWDDAI